MTSDSGQPVPAWVSEVDQLISALSPQLGELPYDATPLRLYHQQDLYAGFEPSNSFSTTIDQQIYRLARKAGDPPIGPVQALAQRLHDHGITVALDEFRQNHRLVGVMGGHALHRGSKGYRQAVLLGRGIAKSGRCLVTGGGPGAMEAANFGAVSSNLSIDEVDQLLDQLAVAPDFASDADNFIAVALDVVARITDPVDNLSVPTWFYGHEPSNPFATHIAKYFSNSEREDGLLAIALSGIVFLAGGPGTMQEVFQDAAQNAYKTYGRTSPMVFLAPPDDESYWQRSGILPALDHTFTAYDGSRRPGWDLLNATQDIETTINYLQ